MTDSNITVHWARYLAKEETDRISLTITNGEAPAIGATGGPENTDHLTFIIADGDWFDAFVGAKREVTEMMRIPDHMVMFTYWGWPEDAYFGSDFPDGWLRANHG